MIPVLLKVEIPVKKRLTPVFILTKKIPHNTILVNIFKFNAYLSLKGQYSKVFFCFCLHKYGCCCHDVLPYFGNSTKNVM